ncbi:unnamed protein product, partial [Rotaria sp. Silwood1]
ISTDDIQSTYSGQLSLPTLSHVRYLILLDLPEHDLEFFERLVHVTPNLNRLSVFFDDLLEIIHVPKRKLCQILQKYIYQLEINLDYSWSLVDIRRDILKILRIFSNIQSLTISLHSSQKRSLIIVKEIIIYLFKYQTNLICINIDVDSLTCFEQILNQDGIDLIKRWLILSDNDRFKSNDYLKNSIFIELNSSSITIWL